MTCVAGELRCVCRNRTCREIQRRVGTAQQLKKPWVARTGPTSLRRIPLAGALEPHRYRSARRCCAFSQCPCLDPWLLTNCHGRWSYLTVTPTATLTLPGRSTSKANMLQACLRRLLRPAMPEMPATLQSLFCVRPATLQRLRMPFAHQALAFLAGGAPVGSGILLFAAVPSAAKPPGCTS